MLIFPPDLALAERERISSSISRFRGRRSCSSSSSSSAGGNVDSSSNGQW